MSRTPSSRTGTNSAHAAKRRPHLRAAVHHTVESLEARRLLSIVPNATLYQEWLDAPADFKNAVAQLEAQYPNFRLRFASDLEILSGTFMGPVLQPTTVSAAQPVLATVTKTANHPKPARHPKPAPHHRKPRRGHRDQQVGVTVQSAAYDWTQSNHTLKFTFSANVSASLANSGALTVQNLSTGNTLPSSGFALSYNSASNTATYSIPWSQVADGIYQATLSASVIQDGTGNHLAGDYNFTNNFFFVTGDLNHDGYNNSTDLDTLAQYYGATGATYAQGDINYDGTVGFTDLLSQSQHYHVTTNLPVPTGLTSPTQTPTTALLIWQPGTGPTAPGSATVSGYNVYRTLNTTTTTATNVAATAFLDTGLTQQTTYSYQLRATDTAGDISLPSHPALSVMTPAPTNTNGGTNGGSGGTGGIGFDTTPPDAPTNLTTSPGYGAPDSSITVSWSPSLASDVVSYLVTRNGVPVGGVSATSSLNFTDSGLIAGSSYTYGVIAFDSSAIQSSATSVECVVGADVTPPSDVVNLSIVSASASSVELSWRAATDNVGIDHYNIYREATGGQPLASVSTAGNPGIVYDWTDQSAADNGFQYVVTAVDGAGNESGGTKVIVPLRDTGRFPGQVISDSNDQYIPAGYENYYYHNIVRALRELLIPPDTLDNNPFPPALFGPTSQQHWYDTSKLLIADGQVVTLQEDENQTGFYPDNHLGDPLWRITTDPLLLEDQGNPVYYAVNTYETAAGYPNYSPVWLDKNKDSIYDADDTPLWDPAHVLAGGAIGRNAGLSSYAIGDRMLIWFDATPDPLQYLAIASRETFRDDVGGLYTDIDKLAEYYPDPRNVQLTETGNPVTKDTIAGLLGGLPNPPAPDLGTGTISINQGETVATLSGANNTQFRPGDSIELGSAWYRIDFSDVNNLILPFGTSIPLVDAYTGAADLHDQAFTIRNWTLLPNVSTPSNPYYPAVSYARGEPNGANIMFPIQFQELAGVLGQIGQAPDAYASADGSPMLTEVINGTSLPLTSELDYENVVPDTNLDGIIDVPQQWTSAPLDTGFISLQPDRTAPQVILPVAVDPNSALPVHAYISQGGFGAGSGPPLLTNPYFAEGAGGYGEWISAIESGLPFAFSLDTSLHVNLYIVTPETHVKRLEVLRPLGNSVVFDFPWDPSTGQFRSYGTPLSGYTRRGDDRRGYILRYMADGSYRLEFPSGVIQEFGPIVPAALWGGDAWGYQFIPFGGSGWDASGLSGITDDRGDTANLISPKDDGNTFYDNQYTARLLWTNGQLSGISYQSNIDPASIITTSIGYQSDGYDVASLTKSATIAGQSVGTIADWSYTLLEPNALVSADPADTQSAAKLTRTGSSVPGSASTVTLTYAVPALSGSRAEAFSYNSDGLLTSDQVTLVEPDGSSSSTTTGYHYVGGSGRYSDNGSPQWNKITEIDFPDNSWEAFQYDDGTNGLPNTGWVYKIVNPFKNSQSAASANGGSVVQYGYDALRSASSAVSAGLPADPGEMAQLPLEASTYVLGIETNDTLYRISPYNSLSVDPTGFGFGTPFEGFTIVGRQAPSGVQSTWDAGQLQSTAILQSSGSRLLATPSVWELLTMGSSAYGSAAQPAIEDVTTTFSLGSRVSQSDNYFSYFGDALQLASYGAGLAPQRDYAGSNDQDPLGRVKHMSLPGGLSTTDSFLYSGNAWWGPSTVTNTDGSTTTYVYTTLGQVQSATTAWGTSGRTLRHDYAYDAAGNVVSDKLTGAGEQGNTAAITTAYTYDALGRMTKEVDNYGGTDATANRTTQWQYTFDSTNNQNVTTMTLPGGATEIKRHYLDGTLASDTGTAVTPTTYDEGVIASDTTDTNGNVETAGSTWTKVSTDGGANYTITYTNMLGQQYLVQQSGPGTGATAGTTAANSYADRVTTFDTNDRPYQVTDFDGSKSFVIYDPLTGQPAATIQDLNGNGTYEPNVDRKSIEHESAFTTSDGSPGGTDSQDLSDAGSSDSSTSDTLSSSGEDYQQTDNGLTTDTRTALPTGPGDWVTTITNPDQTTTVKTYTDGLLTQEQTKGLDGTILSTVTNTYDALGRLATSADWSGTTQYTYFQDGTPMSVQQPGHVPQTVNTIDPLTEQPTKITRPDGHNDFFGYNTLGEQTSQNGSGILPASFGYDLTNAGQLSSLTMYTSGTLNGSGAESTSWAFDAGTGLEKSKTFADGSADTWLYNLAGDLAGVGLPGISAGSVGYNSAGEPTSQSLTDSATGLVSLTVNQQDDMGRPVITTDTDNGKAFSTIDAYTPLGDLARETFGSAGNSFVKYDYFPTTSTPVDGSPDALQTMTVTPASGSSAATNYTYDTNTKQLKTIAVNGTTFTINYQSGGTNNASTDWVSSVQAGNVTINWAPQPASGGLLQTLNATGAGGASLYRGDYYYNAMDQRNDDEITRTNVSDAGVTSPETDSYGYVYSLSKGGALQEVDDNIAGTALNFYTYDGTGNQTGTSLGTANNVNEYSNLSYNARRDVTGDGTYTFSYDANDRMIGIVPVNLTTGSVQLRYGYDGQGHRLWKDIYSYSTTTSSWTLQYSRHYLWDGDNMVAELDGNNNLVTGYTWGPNGLLAVTDYTVSPAKTYAVVSDASGNVVECLDTVAGTVAASFHYDPWGNLTSASGPAKNVGGFRGKGEYVDAEVPTIRHALHRDNEENIWMEPDPLGVQGGLSDPMLYGNDPINNIDPGGELYSQLIEFANNVGRKYIDPLVNKVIGKIAGQAAADTAARWTAAARGFNQELAVQTDVIRMLGGIVDHPVQSFDKAAGAIDAKIDRAKGVYQQTGSLGIAAGDVTNINQLAEGIYNARVLGPPQQVGTGWARFNAIGNGTVGALNTATAVGGAATGTISFGNSVLQGIDEAGGLGVTWRKGMVINPFARSAGVTPQLEEALGSGDLRVISPNEAGLSGAGGRLGSPQTRAQIAAISSTLKDQGWTIVGGGGVEPEEYIPGKGGSALGSAYPDITAIKGGRTLRINTYTTLSDGISPTAEELRRAANLRSLLKPGEHLLMIPKVQ